MDDPDDTLVSELREYFARVDPVPLLVTEAAKAALGWRRLDADLAELLSDSSDSSVEAEALAGVRGVGAPVRTVSFGAGEVTVELEIHVEGTRRTVLGLITPPSVSTIEIETADSAAEVATVESDGLGRFRAPLPHGGNIRLRVTSVDPGPPVETSWITI